MTTVIKTKPAIIAAILVGLTAIVFATQAFFTPEEAESKDIRDYVISLRADDYVSYTHSEYGFSFTVPNDFLVSTFFDEDGDEIIVAEHPTLKMGFQIVISPVDEKGPITKERILGDLPSLVMESVVDFVIEDDTPAIRFGSKDPSLGDTRETWFVREGHLYQIRMHAAHKEWLDAWIRQLASDFFFADPAAFDANPEL